MRRSKLGHALSKSASNYLNTPHHRSKHTPIYQKLIYLPHMLCDINHVLIGSSQIEKISKVSKMSFFPTLCHFGFEIFLYLNTFRRAFLIFVLRDIFFYTLTQQQRLLKNLEFICYFNGLYLCKTNAVPTRYLHDNI